MERCLWLAGAGNRRTAETMRIALIANYIPDKSPSMMLYPQMLQRLLVQCGHEVEIVHPPAVFGAWSRWRGETAKWTGYVDKYLLAPPFLRWKVRKADLVHVCDHSNSMYLRCAGRKPKVITCHDLIAILAAQNTYAGIRLRRTGRWQQRWIRTNLLRAPEVICVSRKTEADLLDLGPTGNLRSRVIYHALNRRFERAGCPETEAVLVRLGLDANAAYFFHVSGNSFYKNRPGVARIFAEIRKKPQFASTKLIMAGKPWTPELKALCGSLHLGSAAVEAGPVSDDELRALYTGALALLFPSREEGFGWPVLEAQACGCAVITSNRPPM
ncbi:MAG TPA: glycosyltransferase, partial [Acidobacteriaceae bacterium]